MTTDRHISGISTARRRGRLAFTLIEMIVVMTIVLILAGLILPAASSMWDQRKMADTETLVQGMLQTARSRAMRAGGVESGLFFFLDDSGVQRVVSIQHDTVNSGEIAWENVFRVTGDRMYKLPAPMRVVPRYVLETALEELLMFNDTELANEVFETRGTNINNAQRHRSFFTMIFSGEGQLLVRRDCLLLDEDGDVDAGPGRPPRGDVTGLLVGYNHTAKVGTIDSFFEQDDTIEDTKKDADGIPTLLPFLVQDEDAGEVAINFPSVDGLLAYDDAVFRSLETAADKRAFLTDTAQPFYVNRYTGAIIRGPVGGE